MSIPTILIGLGGTGSKIVNSIAGKYELLDRATRESIPAEFMVFDTDINDIDKIKNIEQENIFQISTNMTVGGYVERYGQKIASWFPIDEEDLHSKSLLDGAGQIRIFSRLALHAKMMEAAFQQNMNDCIKKVTRLSKGRLSNMRIYLVGSFSGGTGSGIFPSLAVWLAKELAVYEPVIKGILFMPDIYVTAYNLPSNQHENLRTNGYAAIKELETILRNQAGLVSSDLKFEYNPRNDNYSIPHNEQIITLLYLIDYETSRGGTLAGDHLEYENMVVHGIFNQLFTPIGERQLSIEDNNIISRVQNSRENRTISNYCTFGVAAYEYPYEDILHYLGKQYSIRGISSKWLALDDEFKKVLADYHANLKAGMVHLPEPRLEEVFIRKLKSLAVMDRDYYFYKIFEQVMPAQTQPDGKTETIDSVKVFMDSIDGYLDNCLDKDDFFLSHFHTLPKMNSEIMRSKDSKSLEMEKHDRILLEANKERDQPVFTVTDMVFRMAAMQGEEKLDDELAAHTIQTYIRKGSPHPLAVRYFLYDLLLRIEEERKTLSYEVKNLREALDRYSVPEKYEDPKTREQMPYSHAERMALLENRGRLKNLFSGESKAFAEHYVQKTETERKNLLQYVRLYSRMRLYERLHDFIIKLTKEYELFFDAIPGMLETMRREVFEMENFHDIKQQDSFIHYILASAAAKRAVWDEYARELTIKDDADISRQLNELVYLNFVQKRDRAITITEEHAITNYKDEFAKLIVPFNVQTLRQDLAELNFDAATALFKEAEWELPLASRSPENIEKQKIAKISAVFDDLRFRADGFLRYKDRNKVEKMLLFGMHKDVEDKLRKGIPGFASILSKDPGDTRVTESFFSPYIIQAYRIHYNIGIANVEKFCCPEGSYYTSYRGRIRKLNQVIHWQDELEQTNYFSDDQFKKKEIPPHIVPHVDKNWHKSALIAEIDPQEQERYDDNQRRSAVISLLYDFIEIEDGDKDIRITRNLPGKPRITKHITRAFRSPFVQFNTFLQQNPGLVDLLIEAGNQKLKEEYSEFTGQIEKYTLDKGLNPVKEQLIHAIIALRGNETQQKLMFSWLEQLIILFRELVVKVLAEEPGAKEKYFMHHLNYFQQKRGQVTELNDEEYQDFEHLCQKFHI